MKIMCIYLFATMLFLTSCATYDPNSEPPAQSDATPPDDYNPTFIQNIIEYNDSSNFQPNLEINSIDVRQPNLVKIKMNIVGESNSHLRGISGEQFKKYWCEIIDSIDGKEIIIKNPKIYEVQEKDIDKIALAIVIDHSGSMGETRARAVQNAIIDLIQNKKANELIALVKYDNKVVVESSLSSSEDELLSNFKRNGLEGFGGWTAIIDGIGSGINELNKLPKYFEKAVIVFTDGWDNSSKINKDSLVKIARMNNIVICAVDFGDNINAGFMKSFADSTSGIYKQIYRTGEFKLLFNDLYNRLKNYYVIEYKPNEFGNHKVRFKLCFPNDTIIQELTYNNIPEIGSIGTMALNFDFNKAVIKKESDEDIEQIYVLMKAYPSMEIELRGHTDSLNKTGDSEYNIKLSEKRAEAVKEAIVKKGIDKNRIYIKGLGDTEPIASNETEEGRKKNRRTEFIILKK